MISSTFTRRVICPSFLAFLFFAIASVSLGSDRAGRPQVSAAELSNNPNVLKLERSSIAAICSDRAEIAFSRCVAACADKGVSRYASGPCGVASICVCGRAVEVAPLVN